MYFLLYNNKIYLKNIDFYSFFCIKNKSYKKKFKKNTKIKGKLKTIKEPLYTHSYLVVIKSKMTEIASYIQQYKKEKITWLICS